MGNSNSASAANDLAGSDDRRKMHTNANTSTNDNGKTNNAQTFPPRMGGIGPYPHAEYYDPIKHRTLRHQTHATQVTYDGDESISTAHTGMGSQTHQLTRTSSNDSQPQSEMERKLKLQQKFKHQQAQAQSRKVGLAKRFANTFHGESARSVLSDASAVGHAQGHAQQQRPVSRNVDLSRYESHPHAGMHSHPQSHPNAQIHGQGQLPPVHRTNRLRTRSIKLGPNDDEDQWQSAWEEDASESSDDENENGADRRRTSRDRLNSDLSRQVDDALGNGEDAVTWETQTETAAVAPVKPNLEMFSQLRVLGKGSFGKVILTQKRLGQEKGGLFAMKILRKTHLLKKQQIERTRTERKVLSIVDHPFIMKLHFAFQTEDKLFLVLDYCAGGELFFHLSRHKRFPESWTRFYAAELLLALGHLHSKGIIYRDLKPENILLDSRGHLKLGDFGLAKSHIKHPFQGAKSRVGTPEYMAPEVIKKMGHGFTVDYWGLGMVTYEMMTGLPPWYTDDRSKIFKRLLRAPLSFPSNGNISPHLMSFIASLLDRSPHHRLGVRGASSVKCHVFFRRLDFKALEMRRIDAPIRPCEGWRAPEPVSEKAKKGRLLGMFNGSRQISNVRSLQSEEVDAATANFDEQFTRMTLDSVTSNEFGEDDDYSTGDDDDCGSGSQRETLHSNSFVGFTFDDPECRHFDDVANI